MGCFKITWNIFNLLYSIFAVVFAFQSENVPLEVIALCLFSIHIFFTISLNGYASREATESQASLECYLLLQNCVVLILTALLLIFSADSHIIGYAIPFICYISLLHIVCLCVACISTKGYHFLHYVCRKKCCCRSFECADRNPACLRKCTNLQECLTSVISCTCCCKPKMRKKLKHTRSRILKDELSKNLPKIKLSKSSMISSKQSDMSIITVKKTNYKETSDIYTEMVAKKRRAKSSQEPNKLTPSKKKKSSRSAKIAPDPQDNSFTALPIKEEAISHQEILEIHSPKSSSDLSKNTTMKSMPQCSVCGALIVKEQEMAVVPQCQHVFHAHCQRIVAKQRGQRECAKCGALYKHLETFS